MIRLNLIPEEYTQKPPSPLPAVLFVLLVFGGLAFFLFKDFTALKGELSTQERQLGEIESQIQDLDKVEKRLTQLGSEKTKLDERKRVIDEVALSRLLWSRKMFEMCGLVPEKIWLTQVEAKKTRSTRGRSPSPRGRGGRGGSNAAKVQEETNLNISGIAMAPTEEEGVRSVGTFMNNLSGLIGLVGSPSLSPELAEAMAQERHEVEERNTAFRKTWDQAMEEIAGDRPSSELNASDYEMVINSVVEMLSVGVRVPSTGESSAEEDAGNLAAYQLSPEAAKTIHASISFASDFHDAELVLLEDGEYLGKPVKSFTIQCRAIPREKTEDEEEKGSSSKGQSRRGPSNRAVNTARKAASR